MTCPICGAAAHTIGRSAIFPRYGSCLVCTGHFLVAGDPAVYPQEYFSAQGAPPLVRRIVAPLLAIFPRYRLRLVRAALGGKANATVLDYGCGPGNFVRFGRARGLRVVGYEPSQAAGRIAEAQGLPVFDRIDPVPGGYDAIMFWGSLEHTENPLEVLRQCRRHLNPKGQVVIALQNADGWEARLAGERWFHYDYPYHRIHPTPRALAIMLGRAGFRPIASDFFFPEYTIAGLAQTFLNFFLPQNALYSAVSHRRTNLRRSTLALAAFFSLSLLIIFSPLLVSFFLIALAFRKTGAMAVIAERV